MIERRDASVGVLHGYRRARVAALGGYGYPLRFDEPLQLIHDALVPLRSPLPGELSEHDL